MANWYGSARSNYFKVKDLDAFKKAMEPWPIRVHEGGAGDVCLLSEEQDSGGWPSYRSHDDEFDAPLVEDASYDTDIEFDALSLIAPHLETGQVCVMMECGAEKLRYLSGIALAFDHTGLKTCIVSLEDIYALAEQAFGGVVSRAVY